MASWRFKCWRQGIKRGSSISVAVKREKDATSHEFRWDTGAARGKMKKIIISCCPPQRYTFFCYLGVMTRQTHSEHVVNWFSCDRKLVMHFFNKKGSGVALKAGCKCHHAVAWQQTRRSLVSLFCTAKARELDFRVLMQMADTVVSSVPLTHRGAGLDQRAIPWLWSFNMQPSVLFFFSVNITQKSVRSPLLASLILLLRLI